MSKQVFIVSAKRTPFGAFMGKFTNLSATDLGGIASKAALSVLPKEAKIDSVIFGNVLQTSRDAAYLARHVLHKSGINMSVPALTVNRLCGSGFQAVIDGVKEILTGDAEMVLTGGTENMTQSPYVVRNIRGGTRYGTDLKLEDSLYHALVDTFPTATPMGITAENLSKKYKITRQQCDEYALLSQQRWSAAHKNGYFNHEIADVVIETKKGTEIMKIDESPRSNTSMQALENLKPVFLKDGVVTAGNASGISDGASAIILASEEALKKYSLTPLARIVSWNYVGVDPSIMGIGPVPAIKGALSRAGLKLSDMSRIEVNEAFAAQYLAVERELNLDRDITNCNGGAIALGHPLAASGARIVGHLVYELQRLNKKYAIGSACIGGGQGIAVILENCQ